ncbi:hypothetical protein BT67DRAFT_381449 [Trichocladium antarcticum]|uniref:Protein HRI1 n=1 Tax=Trichocladium antarcticum TaxID=1450529 RepID=A0AAN6UJ44_9PEZI|nr:hypothetical protein BT67DRAFT_381449 [Trichocladium antarcticum]
MVDISVREYIRWLPNEPSEPTWTIVLTTPECRFVDVRVLKPPSSEEEHDNNITHLSRLDWAIAGTSSSTVLLPPNGQPGQWLKHSRWHHWIDSRTPNAAEADDEGDMFAHPSDAALTLERGRMVNPDTGNETDYEEMWRSEPLETVPLLRSPAVSKDTAKVTCLALQWHGAENGGAQQGEVKRGLVVRLGQYCQAFARDNGEITVQRLKWDSDKRQWITQVRIGEMELPTEVATHFAHDAQLDDEVRIGGAIWKVVEKS